MDKSREINVRALSTTNIAYELEPIGLVETTDRWPMV